MGSKLLLALVFSQIVFCLSPVWAQSAPAYLPSYQCTEEETKHQASKFFSVGGNDGCGGAGWLEKYHEVSPTSATFLDIGCNRGYTSAEIYALWNPASKFLPSFLAKVLDKKIYAPSYKRSRICGKCNDCKAGQRTDKGANHPSVPITVYCFEPMPLHYSRLVKIKQEMEAQSSAPLGWSIENMAMTNTTGEVHFLDNPECGETCDIRPPPKKGDNYKTIMVKANTVDNFVQQHSISSLAMLKIDAEGFDPLILQGADRTIRSKATKVILFEYHNLNMWQHHSLSDIVTRFDGYGFDCYYDSVSGMLARLTGCWDNRYENKKHSNVVCVDREEKLLARQFESLATGLMRT